MPQIKRYSNRKLYDTDARAYVTLDEIGEMVRRGEDVRVVDHASGADLTALTLAQVIFEQEKKIGGMLPQRLLTLMIQAGGSALESLRSNWQAFSDPRGSAEEEMRRRVQALKESGKLSEEESEHLLEMLLREIPTAPPPPPAAQEERVATEDYQALLKQVEELEQKLRSLQEKPADSN